MISVGERYCLMSSERQRLRPWLEDRVESGDVPGLRWVDKNKTTFRVTWKHAGKPDFNLDKDAVLFRMWAEHTGKYKPGEQPDPSTWKTRFRCALHKMPDVEEVRVPHSLDENEPYRVFRLKPKVPSSPKQRKTTTITQSYTTACPSPPPHDFNPFSYPTYPGYNGLICSQKSMNTTMTGNLDMTAFPSPISSHTSSPANSADFNIFEDIDRITPTIPPFPSFPFMFDQPMDHVGPKPQQPIPYTSLNDDFIFKNNFVNTLSYGMYNPITENHNEPTLTELQSVSRSEQMGYAGGGSGVGGPNDGGLTYNNMTSYNTCQGLLYPGQNGNNLSHPMGLLKIAHIGSPTEMVHEMNVAPVINGFNIGNNPMMDIPTKGTYSMTTRPDHEVQPNQSIMTHRTAPDIKHEQCEITECLLSCRVYYRNKEVSTFEIDNKEHMWRICYEKPVKPADETGSVNQLGPYKAKQILLPDSSDDVQLVLDNFNNGVVFEMTDEGMVWAMKLCQSKVFLSRGSQDFARLSRDFRTKVTDFREVHHNVQENPQNNSIEPTHEFMLSIGEDPTTALVKLVLTPLKDNKMNTENQTMKSLADSEMI